MQVTLIDSMGDDMTPVKSARVSYNWDKKEYKDEQNKALLIRLMKEAHYGTLEHNIFSFMLEVAIPVARQIMRHRTFSYNEASRRYLDDKHTPFEFETPGIRGDKNKEIDDNWRYNKLFSEVYVTAIEKYHELINMGVAKEIARYVIPQGMMTRFVMTGNLRNWLHFLELRLSEHAQKEIREVAEEIKKQITAKVPLIMEAYNHTKEY